MILYEFPLPIACMGVQGGMIVCCACDFTGKYNLVIYADIVDINSLI